MQPNDRKRLITSLENFYEVWSNGFVGDFRDVAKKLADYNTGSLQTAKQIIKSPTCLRVPLAKDLAEAEAVKFRQIGLICTLKHVGKTQLDSVSDLEIHNTLTANNSRSVDTVFTNYQASHMVHKTHDGYTRLHFDVENDSEFWTLLACLRDLVRRNMFIDDD